MRLIYDMLLALVYILYFVFYDGIGHRFHTYKLGYAIRNP